jgi:glycosyltransferase involved in cell wall biosynthesis
MLQKISILIPVYNEELYVEEVLKSLRALRLPSDLKKEIIIVDDGSTDRTLAILDQQLPDAELKICYLKYNFGKGAAIQEGLKHVTGDVVVIQDADLEYSISDYPSLLEPFLSGQAQAVYGSRFLGNIQGMKWIYRLFNFLMRSLVNSLFGSHITDEATAYKLIRTDLLRSLDLKAERFEICPEITAKLLKRKIPIFEVPITYKARNRRQGKKINWKDAPMAMYTLLKYWWIAPKA